VNGDASRKSEMKKRRLGFNGPEVSPLGLGCFGMSHAYGPAHDAESTVTIQRALDLGCNFFDTADSYGAGQNERLLGVAIAGRRKEVVLATKFGFAWNDQGDITGRDGNPAHVRAACEASLQRLQADVIDLYYLHRVDPRFPVEETIGAMAKLVEQGKVRHLGLSEASPANIRRAHAAHQIAALQSEYSLWTRDPERDAMPVCRELGIGFVAFCPLGRGFFTGKMERSYLDANDFRKNMPRFEQENFARNLESLARIEELAREKHCSAAQIALAWILARGDDITAIPGTRRRAHLEENFGALDVELTPEEVRQMDEMLPLESFAGKRYTETSIFNPDT
jgi:aryl-alcohol dehydrogenase-like predicted oxidoreductase